MKKVVKHKFAEVISIVSHQLKTPLSGVKGYLEVLISKDLGRINQEQEEYLKNALENIDRLIRLVQDLLDVSQIEEGKMEFRLKLTNLEAIIREVIKEFSSLAEAKNCIISFESKEKIPLLNIDRLKIKQVVSNLVFNAIVYHKRKGKVELSIERKGDKVLFCCKDNGIGIAGSEKKKIFKKFYRSEKAITLITGGSGLGLFISKAIIEKSGGKIWFVSKKDKGSVFCFSLPIEKP